MTLTYEIDRTALLTFLQSQIGDCAAVEIDTEGIELPIPYTVKPNKLVGWRDTGERMRLTFRTQRVDSSHRVLAWLTTYLQDGPKDCAQTRNDALKAGISEPALIRAKRKLGVKAFSTDDRSREWYWTLPNYN